MSPKLAINFENVECHLMSHPSWLGWYKWAIPTLNILNDARKAKKQNMLMQRILTEGEGRFSTINLLIKIGCFVKKLNLKSS